MKAIQQEIFRAYDIRGIVDQDFDEEWVKELGRACGTWFQKNGWKQAVVGHDCRKSSPAYQTALIEGLLATGTNVVALDMVPTPVFYYAIKHLNCQAGVIITASHNPSQYNGFKIWGGAGTIHTDQIQELYATMRSGNFAQGKGTVSFLNIVPTYLQELTSQIQLAHPLKIVVDGGNGSGGKICAELLRQAGAEVVELYCEPDGNFPNHHPDPTIEKNIVDLKAAVAREKADFGVGLDGDADRIGTVDEQGRTIYSDRLLALFARQVLKKHPGATVIGEVKCSHLVYKDIADHGGNPIMAPTGHSLIKAKMRETNALLAGEMSGHIFFADMYYGFDDALYAALRLSQILSMTDRPLSSFWDTWQQTVSTPEIRVDCKAGQEKAIMELAKNAFCAKYDPPVLQQTDGIRLNFEDGWGLLRASNTQPSLVMRFEANSAERLEEIRGLIEKPVNKWLEETK